MILDKTWGFGMDWGMGWGMGMWFIPLVVVLVGVFIFFWLRRNK